MQTKEYTYDPKAYFWQITMTNGFTVLIFFFAVAMMFAGGSLPLYAFIALIAGYASWNAFISLSNPSKVILEDEGIAFYSYGRTVKYRFDDIKSFRAKDFRGSGKVFLRVNKATPFRGRFWIHTENFNDKDELFLYLLKLEHHTHPDSIKARAWDSTRPDVDKTPYLPWQTAQPQAFLKQEAGTENECKEA